MDFNLPADLVDYLAELDAFIEAEIKPLQAQDDNERFFDHRREWARTDFDNQRPAAPGVGSAAGRSQARWRTTPAILPLLAARPSSAARAAPISGWP